MGIYRTLAIGIKVNFHPCMCSTHLHCEIKKIKIKSKSSRKEVTYLDLDQEVPEVLFKGRNVLIQAEQTRDKHLHLGTEKTTKTQH